MLCPAPELSVQHAFSTLFTAGPCILGLTLNEVMGRDLQQTFVEGDLEMNGGGNPDGVPGRTIILQQNKWDMGAHRFTWVENNLVVAGECCMFVYPRYFLFAFIMEWWYNSFIFGTISHGHA
jgi:hypothetical protein